MDKTVEYFNNGLVEYGDFFSEMMTYFIIVVKVNVDIIITLEGNIDKIEHLELKEYSLSKFRNAFKYKTMDRYCINYLETRKDVADKILKKYKTYNRDTKINTVLFDI